MEVLIQRMIRAAKLDVTLYEEVEADPSTMGQAVAVVVLSSVAAGIGTMSVGGLRGLLVLTLMALASWYAWAYITYFIGTKLLANLRPKPPPENSCGLWAFPARPAFCAFSASFRAWEAW